MPQAMEHIFAAMDRHGKYLKAVSVTLSEYTEFKSVGSFRSGARSRKEGGYEISDSYSYDKRNDIKWMIEWPGSYQSFQEILGTESYPEVGCRFDNLWDFYKYIGYDYKKKKFSDEVQAELQGKAEGASP